MPDKKDSEFKYLDKDSKEIIEVLREDRLLRTALNIRGYLRVLFYLLGTEQGRKAFKDPEFRQAIFHREGRTGFLEHSIIKNPLYLPSTQNEASLEIITATAGKWVGYDFKRESEFGKKAIPVRKGKITSFVLEEIRENEPSDYTPTTLFRFFDLTHLLCMELPSIDYLIEQGLLETRTYREVFQKIGTYDRYARSMDFFEITDKEVYQVTPKGNGLIFLLGDGGDKVKEKKKAKQLVPAYQQ